MSSPAVDDELEARIAQSEWRAETERQLAADEIEKAFAEDDHAANSPADAAFHRRAAELHRAAQEVHEAAAVLFAHHAEELRNR